ncbi:MAG TPA: response regulator [Stellaceae bacterium]|nr:response regulator [Stellaceae bacterium]
MTHILVAEDSPTQAARLEAVLEGAGFGVRVAPDAERALELFRANTFDLVISDVVMPGMSGYELCRSIKAESRARNVPVILVTSLDDPMDVIRGLESGADSFLRKPYEPDDLIDRIRRIQENLHLRRTQRLSFGMEMSFLGRKFTVNSEKEQILDLLISTFEDTIRANRELQQSRQDLAEAHARIRDYAHELEDRVRERTAALSASERRYQEIARRAEQAERTLRDAVESVPGGIIICDPADSIVLTNQYIRERIPECAEVLAGSCTFEEFTRVAVAGGVYVDAVGNEEAWIAERMRIHRAAAGSTEFAQRDGGWVLATERRMSDGGIALIGVDVTPLKAAQAALIATQQQLVQAQKMEAIGNLTGGMAHDFNNLLGVIIGNADLLREGLKDQPEMSELVTDVLEAALRGAELTARLLAFARRQPLRPERVEVNKLVTDITRLLQRTLGEHIEISLNLAPDLWWTEVDPAQLESAITNLATNARDAMHKGGRLIIGTRNVRLDADYASEHVDTRPGDYVMVEVSDTGSGIPPDIVGRIFEPFFTTKEKGRGTGLGLSMVFGFIRQSGGHINVYSEPGEGTTFRLYLPRDAQEVAAAPAETAAVRTVGGGETILVVEDNAKLLATVVKQLSGLGYRLFTAEGPAAAMAIIDEGAPIDLLLSDVVMPGGMSGVDLARDAMARRPNLKVLLTSGFPETRFAEQANRKFDWPLLSKPYRKEELARAVRSSLDGGLRHDQGRHG